MQTIKFSHKYTKMPDDVNNTWLLEVFATTYKSLCPFFRTYDTEYSNSYYKLPETNLIVLLLISYIPNASGGNNEQIWTTVRRWTPEKEAYYRALRGQQVNIEIKEGLE